MSGLRPTLGYGVSMNLELLAETLADEPAYRTRQVWEWAARGAASYAEMTHLPAPLARSR